MPWSPSQLKLFRAAAHNPAVAKSSGVKKPDAERMSKEGVKKMASGGINQINKQQTRSGSVNGARKRLPNASLSKFVGLNKGGVMKKVKRFNGEDEDSLVSEGYDKSGDDEGEDTVYRKSFAGGVKMGDGATSKPAAKPATEAATKPAEEKDSGPKEDTRGVSGSSNPRSMGFRRDMPSAARKDENAKNLVKEVGTTAVLGGAGKLAHSGYQAGKAAIADVARSKAMVAAAERAGMEYMARARDSSRLSARSKSNAAKFMSRRAAERAEEAGTRNGFRKGGLTMKNLFKGKETKEAGAVKSGKITPKWYAKGEASEKVKKFAKGGGIESRGKTKGTVIRMASGGSVSSASRRADGIAQRGKTRG